ncbi:hypothetical protein [Paracoccus salipaludis]|uniref:hypothetical protein n=1 Tax=Paracoccus salipaludis TaxID=2032623 RepID=UPI001F0A5770|nr:hypothetical protein [Paracoccus salipaludis]
MDKKPFFSFDLQAYNTNQLSELARFQKDVFDIGSILEAASNLKYVESAAAFLKEQLEKPNDDFVRLIGRSIYEGSLTKNVLEQLRPAVQAALDEVVRDRIQDKLSISLPSKPSSDTREPPAAPVEASTDEVVTTDNELQAFMIVRAIGASVMPVERITMRDSRSYCAIFADNKNNRPICRLYFNAKSVRRIGVFSPDKSESRYEIDDLADIYKYSDEIKSVVKAYA